MVLLRLLLVILLLLLHNSPLVPFCALVISSAYLLVLVLSTFVPFTSLFLCL